MLVVSDNFIAEQLLLQVGKKVDTVYSVKKAINYSLDKYLQGIPQIPRWVDGSGLSRYNLFTPESFVFLLSKMYREIPQEKLFGYFPEDEDSNTGKNNKAIVYTKSGVMSNMYNLSGYLITKNGKVLIFSYMNNHYRGSSKGRKDEINELLELLYLAY